MKYILITFALVITLFSLVSSSLGQANALPYKFAEYNPKSDSKDNFIKITKRFLKELSKKSWSRGQITIYENDELAKDIKKITLTRSRRKLTLFKSGTKYRNTPGKVEFWLLQPGANLPYPPYTSDCDCPSINLSGPLDARYMPIIIYTANVSGGSQEEIKYKWTISAGKILEGQGTPVIRVSTKGVKKPKLTATVIVGGLCFGCVDKASLTSVLKSQ